MNKKILLALCLICLFLSGLCGQAIACGPPPGGGGGEGGGGGGDPSPHPTGCGYNCTLAVNTCTAHNHCIENMCICDYNDCYDCNLTTHACEIFCKSEDCVHCDGLGHCLPNCNSAECKTCVDGECKVCGGDPTKTCRNGECKSI